MKRKILIAVICACLALAMILFCACGLFGGSTDTPSGSGTDTPAGSTPSGNKPSGSNPSSGGDPTCDHSWGEQYVSLGAEGHRMMKVCKLCGKSEVIDNAPIEAHTGANVTQQPFAAVNNDGDVYGVTPGMVSYSCTICGEGGGSGLYYGAPETALKTTELLSEAVLSFSKVNKYKSQNDSSNYYYKVDGNWYNRYGRPKRAYDVEKYVQVLQEVQADPDHHVLCEVGAKLYQESALQEKYYVVWNTKWNDLTKSTIYNAKCVLDAQGHVRMIADGNYYATVDMATEFPTLPDLIASNQADYADSVNRILSGYTTLASSFNSVTVWSKDETTGDEVGVKYVLTKLSEGVITLETLTLDGSAAKKTEYLVLNDGVWYYMDGDSAPTESRSGELDYKIGYLEVLGVLRDSRDSFQRGPNSDAVYRDNAGICYEVSYVDHAGYGADSYRTLTVAKLNVSSNISLRVRVKWTPRNVGDSYETRAAEIYARVHTHTFAEEFSSDETHHWHEATCGHHEVEEKAVHAFGPWSLVGTEETIVKKGNAQRTCTICGYVENRALGESSSTHWKLDDGDLIQEAHAYGEWEKTPVGVNARTFQIMSGQRRRTCTCGGEDTEAVSAERVDKTLDEILAWFASAAKEKSEINQIYHRHYDTENVLTMINMANETLSAGDSGFDDLLTALYLDASFKAAADAHQTYSGGLWMDESRVVGAEFSLLDRNVENDNRYEGYHYRVYVVEGEIWVARNYQYYNVYGAVSGTDEMHLYTLSHEGGEAPASDTLTGKTFVFSDLQEHEAENYESLVAMSQGYSFVFFAGARVHYVTPSMGTLAGGYVLNEGAITITLSETYTGGQYYPMGGDPAVIAGSYEDDALILLDQSGAYHTVWTVSE